MIRSPTGTTRLRVLQFVTERIQQGAPPTVRDVQEAFAFRSVASAREHLDALVSDGKLLKEHGRARGYRVPGAPRVRYVPLLGRVAAGPLSVAIEHIDNTVAVDGDQYKPTDVLFALRIDGDSMVGAGILHRDIIIVREQSQAARGDIVVALVGTGETAEATVKRLIPRGKTIELHPENPRLSPMIFAAGDVRVLGKVVEVRRQLEQATHTAVSKRRRT